VASGVPEHAATGPYSGKRSAARWNTHLRFALTTGLRFSAHSNENTTTEKGTFLNSFDKLGTFTCFCHGVSINSRAQRANFLSLPRLRPAFRASQGSCTATTVPKTASGLQPDSDLTCRSRQKYDMAMLTEVVCCDQ